MLQRASRKEEDDVRGQTCIYQRDAIGLMACKGPTPEAERLAELQSME